MELNNIYIKNYKSILECEIPIKNKSLCLVGKNESGKSNVLHAIKHIDYKIQFGKKDVNKYSSIRDGLKYPSIYSILKIDPKESKLITEFLIKNDSIQTTKINKSQQFEFIDFTRWGNGLNTLEIILYNNTHKFNLLSNITNEKNIPKILQEFYTKFMPYIEFFDDEKLELESATIEELKGKSKKFETFRRLLILAKCNNLDLINPELEDIDDIGNRLSIYEQEATKIFNKYYFQDNSIDLKLRFIQNKLSLSIRDDSTSFYSISERSPGFRYFFAFLVNKLFTTQQRDKYSIFLLDEPASNLHPEGARDFMNLVSNIKNSQIIYNTHNPFLILRDDLDSLILLKREKEKGTSVNLKPYRNNYQVLRKELGILLNDSFLVGETNITVEGATEKYALSLVFNDLCKSSKTPMSLEWVNIFDCGGVTETKVSLNYLAKNLNLSGLILMDSDKEADDVLSHKKNTLINDLIETKSWDLIRLNDVFTDKKMERTFEDLFPQKLYVEAYNTYCKELDLFDLEFKPLDSNKALKVPIVNEIKSHFLDFFNEKKGKSINKVHIVRIIFSKLDQKDWNKELPQLYKLAKLIEKKLKSIKHGNK